MKRLLVACSYSAKERDAFRALGVDAWSCDFEECEGDAEFDIPDFYGDEVTLKWTTTEYRKETE